MKHKVILIGIGLAAVYWLTESVIHTFVFNMGTFTEELLPTDPDEIWMRFLVACILIIFSVYAQSVITELKQADEETKLAYAELNQIFNTAAGGMRVIDKDYNVLRVNETFSTLSGVSRDEAVGRKCYEVFRGPMCNTPDCPLTRILGGEARVEYEVEKERKDGTGIPCIMVATPFRGPDGELIGIVQDFNDITERKEAEEELKKHHAHLEELVKERTTDLTATNEQLQQEITERKRMEKKLKQVMDDLERSNKDLEQFAYMASHDLQEPLRMVSSYIQLIERRYKNKLDADADEFIAYAVDGASHMQKIINALLLYSRVDTRGKPFEPTGCAAVLDQVLTNLKVIIEESGAVVTHDALPTVMADPLQLALVFQNLIDNAIKFRSDKPPEVHVGVEGRGDEWVFSVRDNGISIAPEYHERIFQIFQRLHGKGEYPGTGIGLAICKRIAERHGGRIWVESESGKGSTFYFTIHVRGGEKL